MGKAIAQLAEKAGDTVVWRLDSQSAPSFPDERIGEADVVIEFTRPDAAAQNVRRCLEAGVRVITGTTGWAEQQPAIEELARQKQLAFLQASNFSLGVNLFFALSRQMSDLMARWPDYSPSIEEVHHIHKIDAPSGTAIRLADVVLPAYPALAGWHLVEDAPQKDSLPITAIRHNEVPGTHTLTWKGDMDQIALTHQAFNRQGFAQGALVAARWIRDRTGVFTMSDVLGLAE